MMPGTPLQSSFEEMRFVFDQFCETGGGCAVVSARADTGIRTSASVSKLDASAKVRTTGNARFLCSALAAASLANDSVTRPAINLEGATSAVRQPGRLQETRGFALPPRDGFAFIAASGRAWRLYKASMPTSGWRFDMPPGHFQHTLRPLR